MSVNPEEAATVAAEYVQSLDNLPNEAQFLLAEIKHKENRSQELQQEIQKEGAKYIRHSLRSATSAPGQTLSAKDTAIPQTIAASYAEIERLSVEKEQLADRLVAIIQRAKARLEHDLSRVLVLQGDADRSIEGGYYLTPGMRNPVQQINESLRNAISIPEAPATPTPGSAPPTKKRRVTATASAGSIKLPSPAPVPTSAYSGAGQRSRLNQVHPRQSPRSRRVTASDEDAEGEEDLDEGMEEGGDAEDKELYCFCQKLSYGEMIACDSSDCRYQWFHLPCVNLKPPLPDSWFCSECAGKRGITVAVAVGGTGGRKGRKK
ncbi:hypothetical protein CERSUDRAFT_80181 [Gelatoporia subvermispora B]|uniref:Chromatin modification-related protein n=1 Tax=Ceriporiopsis subvermispora (strain B) TaxID=914234 RepID=M2R7X2_CERS8|nr:hypothetical protein CERSUDRAFT_80181 [Gelatoporia subvermispora B]